MAETGPPPTGGSVNGKTLRVVVMTLLGAILTLSMGFGVWFVQDLHARVEDRVTRGEFDRTLGSINRRLEIIERYILDGGMR